MNLHEYQGKELLASYGVTIQRGYVATNVEEAVDAFEKVNSEFGSKMAVVKAQIHAGGRGKGGGVKLAKNMEELMEHSDNIIGMMLKTPQTPGGVDGPGKLVRKVLIAEDCYVPTFESCKEFYVSEKLDGTSLTAFLDDEFGVCGRNWQYAEDANNSYWQVVDALGLREKMEKLGRRLAIQGELIGPSIQSNRYGLKHRRIFVFNVFDIENCGYLDKEAMKTVCESLGLEIVPFIENRETPESIDEILHLAEGKSVLNAKTEREGLVWVHGSGSERISFKTISNKFLSRYGD